MRKLTQEQFILKALHTHGYKYDYSNVIYKNNRIKVCIICPIHGKFWITPNSHLNGRGCAKCGHDLTKKKISFTLDQFIRRAHKVHGDKYDYSKAVYNNNRTPINIVCPIHGEFKQIPEAHLAGQGCPQCGKEKRRLSNFMNTEEFIHKARLVHGDRYDYSLITYSSTREGVSIICREHGIFRQKPYTHLGGSGCPICAKETIRSKIQMSSEEFIRKAKEKHGDKFDYTKVDYKDSQTKICIICPIHGEFRQTPAMHLQGIGCPYCRESHGEREIAKWLDKNNISYNREYFVYPEQVLFGRNKFRVDFYLPQHRVIIEYHGRQHYENNNYFHRSENEFLDQQDRDRRLREYCNQNKIILIEIPFTEFNNIGKILSKNINQNETTIKS